MRWRRIPPPSTGDTRTRRCFAWLPVGVSGQWIWLESFYVTEVMEYSSHDGYSWRPFSVALSSPGQSQGRGSGEGAGNG